MWWMLPDGWFQPNILIRKGPDGRDNMMPNAVLIEDLGAQDIPKNITLYIDPVLRQC